jgi:RNA polymerase sigma factor (sigma-70 family)
VSEQDLQRFISEYRQFVYAIFVRYLNLRPEDADELFQRFLFHIWQGDFRRVRDPKAYIARIARNLGHDYRKELRQEAQDCPDAPIDDLSFARIERREMIERALARLSVRDRDLIRRHFYFDQSYADIGRDLGMTTNNVGVALFRAKFRLKKILERM